MLFATLAVGVCHLEVRLRATVTYTNIGARLERLLPELSKVTGLQLVASPQVRDEVMALRFDNVATSDALAKVAFAAWGVWRRDGERLVLDPDVAGLRQAENEIALHHRLVVHRTLAKLHNRLLPGQPKLDVFGRKAAPPGPAEVAAAKLVPFLDEAAIAALPVMRELAYATRPRPLQRRLPSSTQAIFNKMVAQFRATAAKRAGPGKRLPAAIARVPYQTVVLIRRSPYPYSATAFAGYGGLPGLDMLMTVYDARGKSVVSENVFTARWAPPETVRTPVGPTDAKPRPISQSPLTKSLLAVWPGPWLPKGDIQKRFTDPVEFDPAAWFGSLLVDYAASTGHQLAAAVCDQEISDVGSMPAVDLTDRFIQGSLLDSGATITANWIAMRRRLPDPDDTDQQWTVTDRRQLQQLAGGTVDAKASPFWRLIRALRLGFDPNLSLPQWDLIGLAPQDMTPGPGEARLAMLSDDQIETLLKGGRTMLSGTSPAFRAAFSADMAAGVSRLQTYFGAAFDPGVKTFDRRHDVRGEYTEIADSYLPAAAYVYLCARSSYGAYVAAPGLGGSRSTPWAQTPLPFGPSTPLALAYCIKPGVNVLGPALEARR
ncbi:MAG: hypothetical protein ACYC96_07455 [Fimbriimonadaceae bacterium]